MFDIRLYPDGRDYSYVFVHFGYWLVLPGTLTSFAGIMITHPLHACLTPQLLASGLRRAYEWLMLFTIRVGLLATSVLVERAQHLDHTAFVIIHSPGVGGTMSCMRYSRVFLHYLLFRTKG